MILKSDDKSVADSSTENLWEDDILNRKETAELYLKIIGCRKEAVTLCLNSGWGTGKTFFLTRLCQMYRRNKVDGVEGVSIYFNAWQDDNLDDPLLAIVGQLWQHLKEGTFKECAKAVADCAPGLIKKAAFSAGLGALKSVPVLEKMIEEVSKEVAPEDLSTASEALFAEYEKLNSLKDDLKKRFAALGKKVFAETGRPMLFVIDELDRCKPPFAIETLERVKHLFGAPHIVFLFGADCDQLKKSVCAVYGDVDAANYLNRFFDLEIQLPPPSNEQFLWMLHACHEIGDNYNDTPQYQYLLKGLVPLSEIFSFSLRELEKIDRTIALITDSGLLVNSENVVLLPVLITLKLRNEEMFCKLARNECEYAELLDALFGDIKGGEMFDKCANIVRYISLWMTQNHQHEKKREELYSVLFKISKADSLDGIDMVLLPRFFRNVPFDNLKRCLMLSVMSHGYVSADESLPIIVSALGIVRH